jgi:hypothetical protein
MLVIEDACGFLEAHGMLAQISRNFSWVPRAGERSIDGDTPAARLERCAPWHRVIGRGCGCLDQEQALTQAHSSATGSPPITSVK